MTTERAGSAVPPSLPPPARQATGSFPTLRVLTLADLQVAFPELVAQVERLSEIVRGDLRPAVRGLEDLVGDEGSAIHGRAPSGLHKAIAALTTSTDRLTAALDAQAARNARIAEPAGKLALDAVRFLLLAAVAAALVYFGSLHR